MAYLLLFDFTILTLLLLEFFFAYFCHLFVTRNMPCFKKSNKEKSSIFNVLYISVLMLER